MADRPSPRASLRAAAYGLWGCLFRGAIHVAALVALVLLWRAGQQSLFWTLLTVLAVEWLLAAAAGQAVKAERQAGTGGVAKGSGKSGGLRESTAIGLLTWLAVAANLALTIWAYLTLF